MPEPGDRLRKAAESVVCPEGFPRGAGGLCAIPYRPTPCAKWMLWLSFFDRRRYVAASNPNSDGFERDAGDTRQPFPVGVILVLLAAGWLMVIGLVTVLRWVFSSIT